MHGFFPFKTARFQKYRFKERIVERIGTVSTGTSGTRFRPRDSPSENRSWMTAGPAETPLYKGGISGRKRHLPGVRVRVIVRPPPFDLGNNGRKDAEPPPHPLVPGAQARSPSGTMEGTAGHGPRGDHRGSVFRRSCPGRSGTGFCRTRTMQAASGLKMKRSNASAGSGFSSHW